MISEGEWKAALAVQIKVNSTQLDQVSVQAQKTGAKIHSGVGGGAKKADKQLEEAMHHSATLLGETGGHVDGLSKRLGALQGLMGAGLGTAIAGGLGAAAIGIGVEAAQSAMDISEANETANKSLEQAAGTSTQSLGALKNVRDDFIAGNTKFIDSQSEVTEGFATFTREGLDVTKSTRDMNIALDLSKLKHISLTDAVKMVAGAEQGRMKPLIDLGINTKSLNAANVEADKSMRDLTSAQTAAATAHDNVTQAERRLQEMHDSLKGKTHLTAIETDRLQDAQKAVKDATDKANKADGDLAAAKAAAKDKIDVVNTAMGELKEKTDGGRDSTTKMDQAQHDLNNKWQTTAQEVGPPLVELMTQLLQGADNVYGALDAFGKDDKWWKGLNDGLVNVFKTAKDVLDTLGAISDWLNGKGEIAALKAAFSGSGAAATRSGRAAGGPVSAGQPYVVGEEGPEVMVPDTDGTIIPNGQSAAGSHHTHLTLVGTPLVNSPEAIQRMLRRIELVGASA